jgi:voltage-gated potassium channel
VTTPAVQALSPAQRRRRITLGLLRALAATVVLVALYYLLPLDHVTGARLGAWLTACVLVLAAVTIYELRAITRASYPAIRAVTALAAITPLFLLVFAATYYLLAKSDLNNFNVHTLTRTDALYFTVTIFSTVGFGDINATSQATRLLVTAQMILDLLILGLGIRVFIGVVQRARERQPADQDAPGSPDT